MSAERDELFELWNEHGASFESRASEGWDLADAILAAGYRKPRTVTSAAELDALPHGSVVLGGAAGRSVWKRVDESWWQAGWEDDFSAAEIIERGPATLLHEGATS